MLVMGVTDYQFMEWTRAGLPFEETGNARTPKHYNLHVIIPWLIENASKGKFGKKVQKKNVKGEEDDDLMQGGEVFDDNLDRYRAKKADLAELELEQKRGRLIERDLHDEIIMEAGDYVRSALQTLPRSIATTLAKIHSPKEIEETLEAKIAGVLKSIARDPD